MRPKSAVTQARFALFWSLAALLGAVCAGPAWAGLGPEECVLVVNSQSASSRQVANTYIQLRNIPARNVIHLENVPIGIAGKIEVKDFSEKILKPVLLEISNRKLDQQISCVIYSSGFPTAVNVNKFFKEKELEPNKIETPMISITSATYFYRMILSRQPSLVNLEANAYARRPADFLLQYPFVAESSRKRMEQGLKDYQAGNWDLAARQFEELLKENPYQYGLAYWRCRCLAKSGNKEEAVKALMEAIERGWEYREFSETDPELESLKDYTPFQVALKSIAEPYWGLASPVAFQASTAWGPNGLPERLENSANAYLLSCMLGVNIGLEEKTNTEEEILNCLKRSAQADGRQHEGTFYFANHKNVRATTRQPNFAMAEKALKALGFESTVAAPPLPQAGQNILGATIGSANFDWQKSGAKLAPGAIGDNLTSYGARFDKHGQTTLAEFLRHGAAGAIGTVVEPYAIQQKFPHPLIHAYYARGFSLVESYYMSVAGPAQTLLVGDPLCQPFAKTVGIQCSGAEPDATVKGNVQLKIQLNQDQAKVGAVEFFFDGRRIGGLKSGTVNIDTTKHPDGYHELRFVSITSDRTRATDRCIIPLVFQNNGQKTALKAEKDGNQVQVQFQAPQAANVSLVFQGKVIKSSKGEKGQWAIPVDQLGPGPVQLQGFAEFTGGEKPVGVASLPTLIEL